MILHFCYKVKIYSIGFCFLTKQFSLMLSGQSENKNVCVKSFRRHGQINFQRWHKNIWIPINSRLHCSPFCILQVHWVLTIKTRGRGVFEYRTSPWLYELIKSLRKMSPLLGFLKTSSGIRTYKVRFMTTLLRLQDQISRLSTKYEM